MIETLRNRFALPGVHFHQHGRLVVMELTNSQGSASITTMGATVLGYTPQGGDELIWVSETAHFDGTRPVRGGIPICWPWFGAHPNDSAQKAHGFARHLPWEIESVTVEDDITRAILRLQADEATRRIWPHDFVLTLTVTLGETLRLDLTAENRDDETWQLSEALHSYFRVTDARDIAIEGLEGLNYWDKQQGGIRGIQSTLLRARPPIDRVFFDHQGKAVIEDHARRIVVEKAGSATTVVWNPGPEGVRAFDDMSDDAWREMLCVETANAIDNGYALRPGERHTLSATIRTEKILARR
ncbi:aldose epimerase family protein [Guyparkeria halopsychrophila]|uniref:D-hexose-6-phosphate mutarotase n=1 Tax=Guyparkeria halopsychrophila TaxID=3139421 RepID=UPI0037CB8E6C